MHWTLRFMLCERERPLDETRISALFAVEHDAHRTVLGSQGLATRHNRATMAVVDPMWQEIADEAATAALESRNGFDAETLTVPPSARLRAPMPRPAA